MKKIYGIDGDVIGYQVENYYLMKHYYYGNSYSWLINKDGKHVYNDNILGALIANGDVIACETLKRAKEVVKNLIEKEKERA